MNTIIKQKGHELLIGSHPDLTELIAQNISLNTTKIPKKYKWLPHVETKHFILFSSNHAYFSQIKQLFIFICE